MLADYGSEEYGNKTCPLSQLLANETASGICGTSCSIKGKLFDLCKVLLVLRISTMISLHKVVLTRVCMCLLMTIY